MCTFLSQQIIRPWSCFQNVKSCHCRTYYYCYYVCIVVNGIIIIIIIIIQVYCGVMGAWMMEVKDDVTQSWLKRRLHDYQG